MGEVHLGSPSACSPCSLGVSYVLSRKMVDGWMGDGWRAAVGCPQGEPPVVQGFLGKMNPVPGRPLQSIRNNSPTDVTCDFRGITRPWLLKILSTPAIVLVFPLPRCVISIIRTFSTPLVYKIRWEHCFWRPFLAKSRNDTTGLALS